MEEQILLDFVERSTRDEDLRQSLVHNPDQVIDELGLSPLVASVVRRLVPQLSLGEQLAGPFTWWY